MKRWIVVLILIIVAAGGWWGYNQYQAQKAAALAAQQAEAAAQAQTTEQIVWASGKLQPVTWAGLAPAGSGSVARILVKQGDHVKAGDLLLELDNSAQQAQINVAAAALNEAEAALAKLRAGATAAEIAQAKAAVEAAKAQQAVAASQMLDVQSAIDSAQAQVEMARTRYAEVASHPTAAEQLTAQAAIAQAEAALRTAEAAYNLVKGDPNIGARPEALTLHQATAAWEAAKAQADISAQKPTREQLAVAAAAITAAQTQVKAAENKAPGAEAGVKAAMAQVSSAEATLQKLLAGATAEDIAMAEAHVRSARAGVDSARAQLAQNQVIAPFDGEVGAVNVRLGEQPQTGVYAVLLGDTRQMHVETTDLRETDVVRVQVDMPVEVTFDALPNHIFRGVVTQVAPVSSAEKGSTNYTVDVSVQDLDPTLRWGMTAFVNIQP